MVENQRIQSHSLEFTDEDCVAVELAQRHSLPEEVVAASDDLSEFFGASEECEWVVVGLQEDTQESVIFNWGGRTSRVTEQELGRIAQQFTLKPFLIFREQLTSL